MDNRYKTFRQEYEIYQRCDRKADEIAEKFHQKYNCEEETYDDIHDMLMEMAMYVEEDHNNDFKEYIRERFQNQAIVTGPAKICEEAVSGELDGISRDVLGEPLILHGYLADGTNHTYIENMAGNIYVY